jgi:uncharacterized membrane protein YoaK (UPF0700 family)
MPPPEPEPDPHPLERIIGLAAFAAGAVDIISFVKLGGVFASAMTGNLAFLGLYIARLSFYSAIGSALALLCFIVGTACGHILTRGAARDSALRVLLATETALLAAAALLWLPTHHANGSVSADILISLLSASMGFQSIVGKKINLSNIPTVVFTSTLTNLVIGLVETAAARKARLAADTRRQMKSLAQYFAGALCAGVLVFLNLQIVVFLPVLSVAAALVIQFTAPPTAPAADGQ